MKQVIVPVLVVGVILIAGCGSEPVASPPSSSSPLSTTATVASTRTLDAGEQFLKLLGPAVGSLSRSHIVDLGRVMAKDYCPRVKYGGSVVMADLMVSLRNAGFDGRADVDWLSVHGQEIGLAMGLSFCDPRYS